MAQYLLLLLFPPLSFFLEQLLSFLCKILPTETRANQMYADEKKAIVITLRTYCGQYNVIMYTLFFSCAYKSMGTSTTKLSFSISGGGLSKCACMCVNICVREEGVCDSTLFLKSSSRLCECTCMCVISWKEHCHILPCSIFFSVCYKIRYA